MSSTLKVTTKLGGTACNVIVGKVAVSVVDRIRWDIHLRRCSTLPARSDDHDEQVSSSTDVLVFTRDPNECPIFSPTVVHSDEELFDAIKAGVDALPPGTKMILNSGQYSTI